MHNFVHFCINPASHDTNGRYALRSDSWRYVAWVRVLGYTHPSDGHATSPGPGKGKAKGPWKHNRLVVNWTFPPYASELYDHRSDREPRVNDESGRAGEGATEISGVTTAALHQRGGGFDLGESTSVADLHGDVTRALFGELRRLFSRAQEAAG